VSFTPEYPFGYGLSYAKFDYSGAKASAPQVKLGGTLTFSAGVANTGTVEADEIVQFYTHQLAGSVARPVRELKGFQRIHLRSGERRAVTFSLSTDDLAFYNPQMKLVTEPGAFEAWIAPDSVSGQKIDFTVVR
jgi:beta-glucosidase